MFSSIPENLTTKKGSGGSSIDVIANYFSLVQKPDWKLYQYKVEYTPDIEDPKVNFLSFDPKQIITFNLV